MVTNGRCCLAELSVPRCKYTQGVPQAVPTTIITTISTLCCPICPVRQVAVSSVVQCQLNIELRETAEMTSCHYMFLLQLVRTEHPVSDHWRLCTTLSLSDRWTTSWSRSPTTTTGLPLPAPRWRTLLTVPLRIAWSWVYDT